ncbi:glycine-rich domain-containing protein [Chamaesiphon polymorphus]|uniref:Glycine-rich domain-containing protein-like n=1 Tax=Chamaesiphon polymorphus CCALA 037 TaxID=2107692 RepID=A0A2T1GFT0_9CYAN|nr:hypothetical protein [Chamaesiphon polymorphus]PSB56463.1 hypothetical protein C7B77_11755 [Chamaesiphon polymorphus CCALA 037]
MLTTLNPELKQFINRLNRVDFGTLAHQLTDPNNGEGWTLECATNAIEQYRKFLVLIYLYPDRTIVPSRTVDLVWHQAILDTQKYEKDCLEIFGRFIHHYPHGLVDPEHGEDTEVAFAETCQLLVKHFTSISLEE